MVFRVDDEKERDPYNIALGQILSEEIEAQDFGEARMVRATGIPRGSLRRYLKGERDIQVVKLRLIATALRMPLGRIFDKAERRLKEMQQGKS